MNMTSVSQVDGFLVGHAQDDTAHTGCTAILCPDGAVASVCTPGFAPGSREIDMLRPESLPQTIHGLLLSGGSAFGLAAASGVARYLLEQGVGYPVRSIRIPLVPAAVINDYPQNTSGGRLPDENMGYQAAAAATTKPVKSGSFGAGVSATTGKVAGPDYCSPSGIGSYGVVDSGLQIAAIVVVNPMGCIVNPDNGRILSGIRDKDGGLLNREEIIAFFKDRFDGERSEFIPYTVLTALATNAKLDKVGAYRLSRIAATGIARAVYPAHMLGDGDTVFALSSNRGPEVDLNWLGVLAAEVVSKAIVESALATAGVTWGVSA